jgi:hypothetical protein
MILGFIKMKIKEPNQKQSKKMWLLKITIYIFAEIKKNPHFE